MINRKSIVFASFILITAAVDRPVWSDRRSLSTDQGSAIIDNYESHAAGESSSKRSSSTSR
jgi:hypothetical protein